MKHQSETKPISADGNRLFFRRLASWQALAAVPKAHKRQLRRNDRARGNGGSVPGQIFGRVWKLRF
jgi:hypothetical protein